MLNGRSATVCPRRSPLFYQHLLMIGQALYGRCSFVLWVDDVRVEGAAIAVDHDIVSDPVCPAVYHPVVPRERAEWRAVTPGVGWDIVHGTLSEIVDADPDVHAASDRLELLHCERLRTVIH